MLDKGQEKTIQEENEKLQSEESEAAQVQAGAQSPEKMEAAAAEPATAGKEESEQSAPKKPANFTKVMTVVAIAVIAVSVAVGGVLLAKDIHDRNAALTLADGSPAPDSPEGMKQAHSEAAEEVITGEQATSEAEVKGNDAMERITALSDEQLGVKKEDYSFMVAQQAYVIDGEKYVQVIAAEKAENKDGSFSITPHGKYYISFDGKTILKEDMENLGTYEEIKE